MDAAETRPRGSRRLFQFSLRTLLVFQLLACIGMSWPAFRMQRAWRQKEAVQALRKLDFCDVTYDGKDVYQTRFVFGLDELFPPPPLTWAERLFGKDFVHRAETVGVPCSLAEEAIPHLRRLPYLRKVFVLGLDNISDDQLETVAEQVQKEVPAAEVLRLRFDFRTGDNISDEKSMN
jgi:hypothetical protein